MYPSYASYYREPQGRKVTVIGEGINRVQPNVASIHLGVSTENEQLTVAQETNKTIMNRVIQSLLQIGVQRDQIQTTTYNIFPKYDYVDGEQKFRGYEVINTISIRINQFDLIGNVIDTATKNGVNRISNIQFMLENEEVVYQNALREAVNNAQKKAQAIGQTLGVTIDPTPLTVLEKRVDTPSFKTFTAMESSATPIEPGELTIQAIVEAQFQY